jgi:RNA polymerase sigma-70 factor (ECF subfamily)
MTARKHSRDEAQVWSEWVGTHGPAVRGYLLATVRHADVADDLTQEVFCRAWRARDRYREQGRTRAYLLQIADRLACDRARKLGREVNLSDEAWQAADPAEPGPGPADDLLRAEALRQLASALESLSPLQRRVLLLRYYSEMGFAEIAAILKCPLGTALSHCHRGLLALRKLLVSQEQER